MAVVSRVTDTHIEIQASIERSLDIRETTGLLRGAIKDIATVYAEKWFEENADKLYARLNVDAVANLMMADLSQNLADKYTIKENANGK